MRFLLPFSDKICYNDHMNSDFGGDRMDLFNKCETYAVARDLRAKGI